MNILSNIFNTVVQAGKDTINGFDPGSPMSWVCAGLGGWNTWGMATGFAAVGLTGGVALSGVFAAVCFSGLWHSGKQQREAGMPARYIP